MRISKMTLGTAQLGMKYGIANRIGKPTVESAFEILESAWSLGIRSVDTAQSYGESEKIIGSFMKKTGKRFFITTKIPSLARRGIEKDLKFQLFKDVERSLKNLKVESIDNLMLHDFQDLLSFKESVVEVLDEIQGKGLIKYVGASVYTPDEARELMKFDLFSTVQIPFNIFNVDFHTTGTLSELRMKGFKIFARSVFLQGLFFLDPNDLPHSLSDAGKYLKKLGKISNRSGIPVGELAIRFVLSYPIDSLVVGVERAEQLVENARILKKGGLPGEILEELTEEFEDIPNHVKDPRKWNI